MKKITKKFVENTSIEINQDVIDVFEFISSPDSVSKMIEATKNGKPALVGIVHELEERFKDCEGFPLNHEGPGKNAKNRRNIGWMVKFVMREYGYSPVANSERTRIGTVSELFGNAAVYQYTNVLPNYEINSQAFVYCRELTKGDLYIKKDDPEYELIRDGLTYINKKRKEMFLSDEFIFCFLARTGFPNMVGIADIEMMFRGFKTPCRELYDALNNMIAFFDAFTVKKTQNAHEIFGSSTDKALRAFYNMDIDPEKVLHVFVFFTEWDAILSGYYNVEEDEEDGKLISLDAPRMVIVTEDQEYWFNGFTTGYAGQGCQGTQEVLVKLGIITPPDTYIQPEIATFKVLHYFKDGEGWKYVGEDSKRDIHRNEIGFHTSIYRRDGKLVLLQARELKRDNSFEFIEPDLEWLTESNYFIEKPAEITVFSKEDAIKTGHVRSWGSDEEIYQVIISDDYGREVWITYPLEDLGPNRRDNFKTFMNQLGACQTKDKRSFIQKMLDSKSIYGTYKIER